MPIYEYFCPECDIKFELIRSRSEANQLASCPRCHKSVSRTVSVFSHYAASAPDSTEKRRDKAQSMMWQSQRRIEDDKIKNPDPLKPWREERQKALGVGPEKWVEWAKGEQSKEQKKKDYGEGWLGREA